MKRLTQIVTALLLLTLTQKANATTDDGPFTSKADVISYWAAKKAAHPGDGFKIYMNSFKIYENNSGFGPYPTYKYFQCSAGVISADCNSIYGPFLNETDAVSFVNSRFGDIPLIYVDGRVVQPGGFSPPSSSFSYKRCYGDPDDNISAKWPSWYLILDHATTHGGPLSSACLPRP